jgi:hypothetical protein
MNATRPGASTEYSRGSAVEKRAARGADSPNPGAVRPAFTAAIVVLALLGALLLLVAEFTTLFVVRSSTGTVRSVGTGSHHTYAMVPIAVLAVWLSVVFATVGNRPALLGIGVIGIVALLIALAGDLPDAHASGLVGTAATHYVEASTKPSTGLYMETLGAVLLLVTCVCGFVLLGPPARVRGRRASAEAV